MTRIALALAFVLATAAATTAAPGFVIDRAALTATDSFTVAATKKKVKKKQNPGRPPAAVREERGS